MLLASSLNISGKSINYSQFFLHFDNLITIPCEATRCDLQNLPLCYWILKQEVKKCRFPPTISSFVIFINAFFIYSTGERQIANTSAITNTWVIANNLWVFVIAEISYNRIIFYRKGGKGDFKTSYSRFYIFWNRIH